MLRRRALSLLALTAILAFLALPTLLLRGQATVGGPGNPYTSGSGPCSATSPANQVCAGPAAGGTGAVGLRSLVLADLPSGIAAATAVLATTANALTSAPTLCTAGSAPQGILANGNAYGCQTISGVGGGGPIFVDQITPTGTVDGVNNVYTIPDVPSSGSLYVWRNGLLMAYGADYVLSSSTIVFFLAATPQPGDILLASYRH